MVDDQRQGSGLGGEGERQRLADGLYRDRRSPRGNRRARAPVMTFCSGEVSPISPIVAVKLSRNPTSPVASGFNPVITSAVRASVASE